MEVGTPNEDDIINNLIFESQIVKIKLGKLDIITGNKTTLREARVILSNMEDIVKNFEAYFCYQLSLLLISPKQSRVTFNRLWQHLIEPLKDINEATYSKLRKKNNFEDDSE